PQYITHVKRLKGVEEPVANFLASGLFRLKDKLGPILWQFPPNVTLKDDRFEKFLKLLPFDAKSAMQIAKKHGKKMEGRNETKFPDHLVLRHAFEFRHPSFQNPDFIEMLRDYGVAVVFAHSGLKSPYMEDLTADFVYARMHGQEIEYKKGYSQERLSWWADRVSLWMKGQQPTDALCVSDQKATTTPRDAFIYFDTEEKAYAPMDALNFSLRMGIKEMLPEKKPTKSRSQAG
ncbi:MAG: DUF72 domain-containing protein, partial [Bdellovibrionales bacterium]|nr:DUF72 domain-containing protein [Bdellovibrionales bacterium]